jgi:hypothetical protein
MKIIDIGICINNNDPKGLGRIRCVRFSDYVSEKERAGNYEPFSDNDIFVANPFLPTNINFVPEIDQAVKIINYNTEKENVNQEYISGPFTTVHNFNDQSFSPQTSETTYGNTIKSKPDIFDRNENYRKKSSEGSSAKKTDYGIYGKYGSDLIFTENGLQLRGGKLLSKERAKPKDREDIYSFPIMSKKSSVLTLKKFPNKMELKKTQTTVETAEVKDLNHLIEYNMVDNEGNTTLTNPYAVKFFVYKILKPYGDISKTNNFNENSTLPNNLLKLINLENDNFSATHQVVFNSTGFTDVAGEIRDFIYTLHENSLKKINSLYDKSDLHPFYFRPKQDFITITGTTNEITYKKNILSSINIYGVGPKSGLLFSSNNILPIVKKNKIEKNIVNLDKNYGEQTFSSLKSDKIYFLSTDTNKTEKLVPFEKLDKYEYTQSDYIEKIDPNTYSTVRGENLVRIIEKIISVLFEHQHNVVGPMVKTDQFQSYVDLIKLIETMKNDLLNGSIRIN